MADRRAAPLIAAATAATAAGWTAIRRADQRRVEQDPEHEFLFSPLEGEAHPVRSPDGTVLHAEVFGPAGAPTIVLVHGWMCRMEFWKYQLRDLGEEFRVVAYDQRGHGRSGAAANDNYSIEALAADFQAVLETLVPQGERVVAAGHSMGAMTMVAWAGEYPGEVAERLSGAVLVNTGMGDLISETLIVRLPTPLGRVKQTVGRQVLSTKLPIPSAPTPLVSRAVRYVAASRHAGPACVAFVHDMVLECPGETRGACGNTMSRMEIHDAIAHLDVPTIVLGGTDDRLTPIAHVDRMAAELPNLVEDVHIERSGHMSPLERPEIVTRQIRRLAQPSLRAVAA